MLDPAKVDKVVDLSKTTTFSQRTIARMAGVSRSSVTGIVTGKRPAYSGRGHSSDSSLFRGFPSRCPQCGAMAFLSCSDGTCLECVIKVGRRKRVYTTEDSTNSLGIDMPDPEELCRYERIRDSKRCGRDIDDLA